MITKNFSELVTTAPEEHYPIDGKWVTVSRQDLAYKKPLPPNAKMSALYEIVKQYSRQYKTMVLFAKKQKGISYCIGFPVICKEFGVTPIITYPKSENQPLPDWMFQLGSYGPETETIQLHPNMVTINVNQSKQIAEQRNGFFIPFGFDHEISVMVHSEHFNVYRKLGTLVMATMTGMTLAGAIDNINRGNKQVKKIVGISCGRPVGNVIKSMEQYVDVPQNVEIINPYERNHTPDIEQPFPLHPDYELKAWAWMLENIQKLPEPIYFINVGA